MQQLLMPSDRNTNFVVLCSAPVDCLYSLPAPEALDFRDVGCRAILAHQLYTDTVGAMETLVPLSSNTNV